MYSRKPRLKNINWLQKKDWILSLLPNIKMEDGLNISRWKIITVGVLPTTMGILRESWNY